MENDNILSPKNPSKTIEDHGVPAGSKKRKSMSGGSENLVFRKNAVSEKKQRMKLKDNYSASISRSSSITRRISSSIPYQETDLRIFYPDFLPSQH